MLTSASSWKQNKIVHRDYLLKNQTVISSVNRTIFMKLSWFEFKKFQINIKCKKLLRIGQWNLVFRSLLRVKGIKNKFNGMKTYISNKCCHCLKALLYYYRSWYRQFSTSIYQFWACPNLILVKNISNQ